jgi:uncharacterized protein YjiS (DUF1127 family)
LILTHLRPGERTLARAAAPEAHYVPDTQLRPLFSFFECEQQARINRNLVIQACMRGTMRAFAQWLRVLVLCGTRWVRGLTAKQRLRSAVRELQRLDDRMLADIGLTRGEIESAVRDGLPMRMMRQSRHRDWNGIPARRQAA